MDKTRLLTLTWLHPRPTGVAMKDKKHLETRQDMIRSRLAELGGQDASDDGQMEIRSLSVEYGANADRLVALGIADDAPTVTATVDRQRVELFQRASVGDLVYALVNGRSGTDGAMRELQADYGLGSNEIHVRQLTDDYAVTPAPGNVGQEQQAIIPFVFPSGVAAFLGVDQPTVGVGDAVFPVLTSTLDVHTPAENAAAAETTGAFSGDVLTPSRIQAAFSYSREDRARFAGMDSSLRENLSMGLSDGLDKAIVAGTNGLLTGTNLPNHNVTAATTFDLYISQFAYGRVDGRYASMTGDLRAVMGNSVYADAGQTYRNASVDRTALDRLMELTGGLRVSAHVPAVDANKRQNNIIRRGMQRDMVAPIWENIALLPDEITKAANGQIVLTAIMLHAVKILRQDGFYKQMVQTA